MRQFLYILPCVTRRNKNSKFRDVNPLDIVLLALQVHSREFVPCDVAPYTGGKRAINPGL
jgi:hypothetical protein